MVKECAMRVGLFPIELNEESIELVQQFIKESGADLTKEAVVPLGYDWSCESNFGCNNKY